MPTKHEQILNHIANLPIGEKISVRKMAKLLSVSEGTAYRAIKEADNLGFVSTIDRVGTIRIDRKLKSSFERLTFAEVARITDSEVLGGKSGLDHFLNRFVIGAMKKESMEKYLVSGGLMIVGNRVNIQKYALQKQVAVLVTGGFEVGKEMIELANLLQIPIMRTAYDTFATAALINHALTEQGIKNKIMKLSDILKDKNHDPYLSDKDQVKDYKRVREITGEVEIPVVDECMKLVGMVSAADVMDTDDSAYLLRKISSRSMVAKSSENVVSVAHRMILESVEKLPVVDEEDHYLGMILLSEIHDSLRTVRLNQDQNTQTLSERMVHKLVKSDKGEYFVTVTPKMIQGIGMLSYGVMSEWVVKVSMKKLEESGKLEIIVEQIDLHFLQMIPLDSDLHFYSRVLEKSRWSAKVMVDVYREEQLVATGMVSMRFLLRR